MTNITFANEITKGAFSTVTIKNQPKMNKRNNPYLDRVECMTVYHNCQLGCSYQNSVDASLGRCGIDSEFIAEKPKGMHFTDDNGIILQSDTNDTLYVRIQMYSTTKVTKTYYLDGVEVTDPQILEEIKSFIPQSKPSQKQENAGLSEDKQVIVRSIKLENVLSIKQGDRVYE